MSTWLAEIGTMVCFNKTPLIFRCIDYVIENRIEVKIDCQMIHILIIVCITPTDAGSQSLINQPTWWCIE